ncbi:ceramide synthase 6-like [Sycon ciliatum]|uniref:ceramide synthase 6-like n=1 Tax=Sycon ciliatum TaxID=27933 RepID=UPI0031F6155C
MDTAIDYAEKFFKFDETVWLGPNFTWASLRDESDGRLKPQLWHFQYVLAFTVAALLIRALLDRILFLPLGRLLQVSERLPVPPPANSALEALFKSTKHPSRAQISEVASASGWSEQKVQKWLKRRKASGDRGKMPKFQEACWRFMGYTSLLIFGYWALKDTDYFMDTTKCWTNYPHETVPVRVFWFYMLELAFYASLTCSHFFDTRRKDFWEMLIHHFATITLIMFSFSVKHIAIGSLIMFVHDIADPWLEIAKAFSYTRVESSGKSSSRSSAQSFVDVLFAIFAVVFWVTRLYVFPRYLIYSVWVESLEILGFWPFRYVFLTLLNLLLVLHCFWSYLILVVVSKAFQEGKVGEDSRSDDEGDSADEDDTASSNSGGDGHGSSKSSPRTAAGATGTRQRPKSGRGSVRREE